MQAFCRFERACLSSEAIDTPEKLKKTIQSVQSVEVAFDKTSPKTLKELEKIPSVNEVRKEGDKFRLYTHDQANVLSGLWGYVKANDLKPVSLNTLGPSLEDVFVRLTEIDLKTSRRNFNE